MRYLKSVLLGIILLPEVSNAYRVAKDISAREMVQVNEQGIFLMLEFRFSYSVHTHVQVHLQCTHNLLNGICIHVSTIARS